MNEQTTPEAEQAARLIYRNVRPVDIYNSTEGVFAERFAPYIQAAITQAHAAPKGDEERAWEAVSQLSHWHDFEKIQSRDATNHGIILRLVTEVRVGERKVLATCETKTVDLGLNFVTLNFPDCRGNKIKVVPTMEGNLQIGEWAGIVTSEEFEAIAKLRLRSLRETLTPMADDSREETITT